MGHDQGDLVPGWQLAPTLAKCDLSGNVCTWLVSWQPLDRRRWSRHRL